MSTFRRGLENALLKSYPDGSHRLVATVGVMGAAHGARPQADRSSESEDERAQREQENRDRARRRARAAVRDLALSNRFDWFVTLTLDGSKIDRYDPAAIVRKVGQWLSNAVRRRGLKYVLVPEYHKDGAIHFHGFMSGDLGAVPSGHKDRGGHEVFNLSAWPFGFSTAIRPYGDHAAAVAYCCKYISKQDDKIGGRWYYSGGDLARPKVTYLDVDTADLDDLGAFKFKPQGTRWPVWVLEIPAAPDWEPLDYLMIGFRALPEDGLHFGDSQMPPAAWLGLREWPPTPDEWQEQIRMEENGK